MIRACEIPHLQPIPSQGEGGFVLLLHPQHAKRSPLGYHPESCLAQTRHDAPAGGGAVAAVGVADVVEQAPAGFEDPIEGAVHLPRVEVPGEGEGRRVVDDGIECSVCEHARTIGAVADQRLNVGAVEQLF